MRWRLTNVVGRYVGSRDVRVDHNFVASNRVHEIGWSLAATDPALVVIVAGVTVSVQIFVAGYSTSERVRRWAEPVKVRFDSAHTLP